MMSRVRRGSRREWLRVSDIEFDERVNRPITEAAARRIAVDFNPDKMGTLTVSRREDGTVVAVNGQHRLTALRLMGWDDQQVECDAYTGLSLVEEAEMAIGLNDSRRHTAIERHRKAVIAQRPVPVEIDNVVESRGFHLTDQVTESGGIAAVVAVYQVFEGPRGSEGKHPTILGLTLATIADVWGHDSHDARSRPIIAGLGLFMHRYLHVVDFDRLTLVLSKLPSPAALIGKGKAETDLRKAPQAQGIAAAIQIVYNAGLRAQAKKLEPWWG